MATLIVLGEKIDPKKDTAQVLRNAGLITSDSLEARVVMWFPAIH